MRPDYLGAQALQFVEAIDFAVDQPDLQHIIHLWQRAYTYRAGLARSGRDPLLQPERMQGFAADPVYVKGEVFAYVGLPQNLKDLKRDLKRSN